jgi:hypothetical protein
MSYIHTYTIDQQFFNALYGKNINDMSKLLHLYHKLSTKKIYGASPLYIATSTNEIDLALINLLLENGAKDINVAYYESNRTPLDNLDYYNVNNKDEIMEYLKKYLV